jgi:hypothetical protein
VATQLFFGGQTNPTWTVPYFWSSGTNLTKLDGSAVGWSPAVLRTTRGTVAVTGGTTATVAGPTSGVEWGSTPLQWVTAPLDQDITISGTITFNLWMGESATAANCGAQCVIERISSTGAVLSTIANSEKGTELPKTSAIAAQNWTAVATSTNMLKGDRIRVRVAANDAGGTMASGNTFTFDYNGPTGGADGDSFVTFNETFGFLTTDPTTTTIYPTDTASAVATAAVDWEAWTSRGAGVQTDVTNTAAGWTAPIQVTDTAGGTVVDWWTKPLQTFTLSAPVFVNARGLESNASANASWRCEIAITAGDGSSPTVWAATTTAAEILTTEQLQQFYLAGADTAVTDGQRLRIRFYIDDSVSTAMGTGFTVTLFYAGTSGGASGDTYLIFNDALAEYVAATKSLAMNERQRRRRSLIRTSL